jgi:O-antigen ligase
VKASENRGALLKEAWELFKQNPIIPAGIGRYSLETKGHYYIYPHNIPLEFAAEFGIWGLLFYCSLFSCVFCGYWRLRHTRVIREHSVLYLFVLLISLKQGCIYNDKAFWVWATLGLGLLGWRKVSNKCMIEGKIES